MKRPSFWRRYARFFGPDPAADVKDELRFHLEAKADDLIAQGWRADAACAEAERQFGDLRKIRRIGVRIGEKMERRRKFGDYWRECVQDVRYTFRALTRDRGFAAITVLILALGIGANVVVFSVVNTILLRQLPFQDSRQLAWIAGNNGKGGLADVSYRVDAYEEFQRHNQSFQIVTGYAPYFSLGDYKLMGYGEPKPVSGVWVMGDFFQALGVQPMLGRLFTADEVVTGGRPAVLLSYSYWQRQFEANPAIVGQAITLSDKQVTVVGVLPPNFDFGAVFAPGSKMDVFTPINLDDIKLWGHMLSLIGRLKPGVTIAQAQAEANILFPQLKQDGHPEWNTDAKTTITGLKDYVSGSLHRSLVVLWCAVGLILLIVCVNLSNLLLARATARSKEFAMRTALGAGRGRLLRQLLTESLVLSSAGALLGLGIAYSLTAYLAHQGSLALPLLNSVRVDSSALLWTLLMAIFAAIFFGLAPAFRISNLNLQDVLKDAGHGTSSGGRQDRMRSVLVVSEVALACVLLVGAGLLLRSFIHLMEVDLGFQPSHAFALKVDYDGSNLKTRGNPTKRGAILQEMLHRVGALPGVEAVGFSDKLPLDRNRSWNLYAKGKVYPKDANQDAFVYIVTPGYLKAMGMHLIAGRDLSWTDTPTSETSILINQAAARRDWPGEDPVGRLATGIGEHESRVVGIFADVRESRVEETSSPEVLVSVTQAEPSGAELVVRSALPIETLASSVMSTLRSMNPGQPATQFRPIQQIVDRATSPRRFFAVLVSSFAALGLLLSALGIYGVISYSVTRQTQEIGIRMALGATAQRVQMDVIARALRLTLMGIVVGTVSSFVAAKGISSLLFGTTPTDPVAFTGMILLLGTVALIAAYIPARRASQIDPMIALRSN